MKRLAVCLLFLTAAPVLAQESVTFSIGGGAGAAIPTGDLSDGDAELGFGFDVSGAAHFNPMLAIYARYSYYTFGVDTGDPDVDANYNDSGFGLGARLSFAGADEGGLTPWFEGGLIYNSLEVEGSSGGVTVSADSDWGVGFEVGAGLDVPVSEGGLVIQPRAYFRSYSPEDGFTVSYGVIGVGLSYAFGQ